MTDILCWIPVGKSATPAATSAVGVSGRRAAARHAPFQDINPVPVTVAPRLVDESETRARVSREQHPQRAYGLPSSGGWPCRQPPWSRTVWPWTRGRMPLLP